MKNHEHRDKKYAKYWCAGDLWDHGRYERKKRSVDKKIGTCWCTGGHGRQEDTDDTLRSKGSWERKIVQLFVRHPEK
jgi:hypothetical protein